MMGLYGNDLPTRKPRYRAVTADVPKWYNATTADAVAATHQLVIYGFHGCVTTAEAGAGAVFSDEDGTNPFGGIDLTATGNFQVSFTAPKLLPLGKDIKVDVTMSTGRFSLDFDCAYITM